MEMRKYFKLLYGFAGLLMLFYSCKKDTDLSYSLYPVVAGYLYPGKEVKVRVTYQKGPTDTAAYGLPVQGLSLSVSNGLLTRVLTEDAAGYYVLRDTTFVGGSGVYSLSFEFEGKTVSATTVMPAKPGPVSASADELVVPEPVFGSPPADPVTVKLSWNNPDLKNHMVFFKLMEQTKVPINGFFSGDTAGSVELNVQQAAFVDIQRMNFRYLGRYKVILARVNPEYVELLDGSGNSSQNLTNPPTNVKNGFGIFTAIQMDTLTVPFLVRRE